MSDVKLTCLFVDSWMNFIKACLVFVSQVFVDSRVESEVRESSQSLRKLGPLPELYKEKA